MRSAEHVGGLHGHDAAGQPAGSSQVLEVTVETLLQPHQAGRVSSDTGSFCWNLFPLEFVSAILECWKLELLVDEFNCISLLPPCGVTVELKEKF